MLKTKSYLKVVLVVILVSAVFVVFENNRTPVFTNVVIPRTINTSINCFKNLDETLPDIETLETDSKISVFFVEVSCQSSENARISILPRQACAIESAAFTNPNLNIYVAYAASGVIDDKGSLSDYLLKILQRYKNVKFLHFDLEKLVAGSSVEILFAQNKVLAAAYPMIVVSDIARLLILQKFGGLYLDLDVIVLNDLDKLPSNSIGRESHYDVNNAVMRISKDTNGKRFIQSCLEELKNHFVGSQWQLTGPAVVTKVMKIMCGLKIGRQLSKSDCSGFTLLPIDAFYPVKWQDWENYFQMQTSDELLNHILNTSYVVHLWNKFSVTFNVSDVPDSIYNTLAKKFCPRVYNVANQYF